MFSHDLEAAFCDPEARREERKAAQPSKFVIVAGDSSDDSSDDGLSSDSLDSDLHDRRKLPIVFSPKLVRKQPSGKIASPNSSVSQGAQASEYQYKDLDCLEVMFQKFNSIH